MKVLLLLTFSLTAPALYGQDKKPADPKVPAHSPEQSALNRVKQDSRNKDILKKGKSLLDKALNKEEAARKEVERTKPVDEAKARLEKLKNSVDPDDIKEFKRLAEEEVKKAQAALKERMKKEGNTAPVAPVPDTPPEPDPTPGSFENTAPQEVLPVRKGPVFRTAPGGADHIVGGLIRDPKNPDVDLPKSDPRTRTFVLTGNAQLRQPDIVLDADNVTIVFKEGQAPGNRTSKPKKPAAGDPVKPGRKNSPIESLVAQGHVRFMYVDETGHVQAGRCGHLIFEEKSGLYILKDWPEIETAGRLLRGPKKESIMRMSRTQPPEAFDCELIPLDRELVPTDVPKDKDTPIPPHRPPR
ncbi:MAG TPA: LptA/OstA family protein [Verrucomicrobiales bacterium]|jgi:hypothetical protein|nr:LptA/OstA family protein [Verrucomicrobiales bacterium]